MDAILPYFDPRSVKKEVDGSLAWSPLPSLVPQCLKLEIKDEVIVEEDDMVELSYDAEAVVPHSQIMEVCSDDVNPDELLGPKEEQTTCFVDVDTLQTVNSSCDDVFSDPLLGEEEDLAAYATREEKSSHYVIAPPVLRRSGRIKKWDTLGIKVKGNLPNVLLKPKSVCTYQRACYDDNNILPKLRRGVQLSWMKQQRQKVEQHILEVRTQKAIDEKRFQTSSEQSWRDAGIRYRPNVNAKLLAQEREVKFKDALNNGDIQNLESESNSLTCPLSDYMIQSKHVLSCIQTKPYSCYKCGMSFHCSLSRMSHVVLHHKMEGEHVCHQCGRLFPQVNDLENHRKTYCDVDFVKYPCSVCNEEFCDMSSQIRHSMKHINESEQCREGLQHSNMPKCSQKNEEIDPPLLDHELMHNSTKTHPSHNNAMKGCLCKVCDKVFKGTGPYACYACGKTFDDLYTRAVHVFSHIGKKPYSCPTCNTKFTVKTNLDSHMTTHL